MKNGIDYHKISVKMFWREVNRIWKGKKQMCKFYTYLFIGLLPNSPTAGLTHINTMKRDKKERQEIKAKKKRIKARRMKPNPT